MNFRVIKKEQQKESNWSGGKTYELAIFPEDAKYLDRDFIWRLSTANSDREESSFTKLPDYDRILMVLEGDVVLAHGDVRSAHLQALEQDSFDGAVKTKCFGKLLRDYNLIYAKGGRGRMELLKLTSSARPVPMDSAAADAAVSYGLFCLDGYAVITCGERSEMIRPDEQAVIDFPAGVTEDILVMGEGQCILTEVVMEPAEEMPADPETGAGEKPAEDAGDAAGAAKSPYESDYLTSLKLFLGRNRWAMVFRREGRSKVYYDRALSLALRKLERWHITELSWVLGVILCFLLMTVGVGSKACVGIAILFTLVHFFAIVPLIYMSRLPRPFKEHMKSVSGLNAAERAFHQEEITEDPHFESLMRKYKSDDDNYFADESSPLYRLVRKK